MSQARSTIVTLPQARYVPVMENELDATGLLCPLPVLKARKKLQSIAVGEVLVLTTDDPAAVVDVPHFCAETGHELVCSEGSNGTMIWHIKIGA